MTWEVAIAAGTLGLLLAGNLIATGLLIGKVLTMLHQHTTALAQLGRLTADHAERIAFIEGLAKAQSRGSMT